MYYSKKKKNTFTSAVVSLGVRFIEYYSILQFIVRGFVSFNGGFI